MSTVNNTTAPQIFDGLTGALTSLNTNLTSYVSHTNRISGVNLGATGPSGEPGLNGLVGMAKSYNSVYESVTGGNEDNFSQIFGSILGIGEAKLNNTKQRLTNEVEGFVSINSKRVSADARFNAELSTHISSVNSFSTDISNLIINDNSAYETASRSIRNYNIGNILINSSDDPCFTGRLIDRIASKSMKEKINGSQ